MTKRKSNPRKAGRPSTYTEAVAEEICTRLSHGESLLQISRDKRMPHRETVLKWTRANPVFAVRYAQARRDLMDHWADEILDISDDGSNDWVERETRAGRMVRVMDNEVVNRSKLRVDSRRWLLSKLRPEEYGERLDLSNKDGSLTAAFAKSFDQSFESGKAKQADGETGNGKDKTH